MAGPRCLRMTFASEKMQGTEHHQRVLTLLTVAKNRESSIRWTGIAITQIGYAINLILTFSTASLGFALSLLRDKDFSPMSAAQRLFDIALLSLGISIVIGIACVFNRLKDFRASRAIATEREKLEDKGTPNDKINEELRTLRRENKDRGENTWKWLRWQASAFGLGIASLVLSFLVMYSVKLGF